MCGNNVHTLIVQTSWEGGTEKKKMCENVMASIGARPGKGQNVMFSDKWEPSTRPPSLAIHRHYTQKEL